MAKGDLVCDFLKRQSVCRIEAKHPQLANCGPVAAKNISPYGKDSESAAIQCAFAVLL